MKIFNIENKKEKVYVRIVDLFYLLEQDDIPYSIYYKLDTMDLTCCDENEFIEFSEPQEIEFFRQLDWLIDYNKYIKLNKYEIIAERQLIIDELKISGDFLDEVKETTKTYYNGLLNKCEQSGLKLESLDQILAIKKGVSSIHLPLVADSDSLIFSDETDEYRITKTLDHYKLLVFRKENKLFDVNIPLDFIKSVIKESNYKIDSDFEISYVISDDKKYLIVDLLKCKKQEMTIKRLIRTLLFK